MFRNFLNECDCKFKTLICPKGSDSDCQVCFEQAYYKTDAEHSDHYNCLKAVTTMPCIMGQPISVKYTTCLTK